MMSAKTEFVQGPSRDSSFVLTELLLVPTRSRGRRWLRRALQAAIKLEFATIPPYLAAYWSLRRTPATKEARKRLLAIVLEEMGHMGLACNLLVAFGGKPQLASRDVVPRYPGELPFRVKPGLMVALQRFSSSSLKVFMRIEEPHTGGLTWHLGKSYPTIGAFYLAIFNAISRLSGGSISETGQLEESDVGVTKIGSKSAALDAVTRIRQEGEGTEASPYPNPTTGLPAHFFSFGELYHQGRLIQKPTGFWEYDPIGHPLPLPPDSDIHQMARIPRGGYPAVSKAFDQAYSQMIRHLQAAWDNGSQAELSKAVKIMIDDLERLAKELMEKNIPSKPGQKYGPSFLFYP